MVQVLRGMIPEEICAWMDGMDYRVVITEDDLEEMEKNLAEGDTLSLDTETSGSDYLTCTLAGFSASVASEKAYYVPLNHKIGLNCPSHPALAMLQRLVKKKHVVMHNAKFDLCVLSRYGIDIPIDGFGDPYILAKVEDFERKNGLKELVSSLMQIEMMPIEELFKEDYSSVRKIDFTTLNASDEATFRYACADADMGLRLWRLMKNRVEGKGLDRIIDLETHTIPAILEMETTGFPTNIEGCKEAEAEIRARLEPLEKEILNGLEPYAKEINEQGDKEEINIESPDQLRDFLFERMKWPVQTMTKKKKPSVDKETLGLLVNKGYALANKILEHRTWKKRLDDFVLKFPKVVDEDGRLRTELDQFGASSGRFTSKKRVIEKGVERGTNMQQVPSKGEGKKIRSLFKAPPWYYVMAIDFSQIEYRLFAAMSGEQALIDSFLQGADYHSKTAAVMFKKDLADVTPEERSQGKTINFCLIFGGSEYALSSKLQIPVEEALELKNAYFQAMPRATRWLEEQRKKILQTGTISTIYGRRRFVPNIQNMSRGAQGYKVRSLMNSIIQGTAADICKFSLVNLWKYLHAKHPGIKMVLQVHDEVVLFVPNKYSDKVALGLELASVFEWTDAQLAIPIKCDVEVGPNWGEMQEIIKGGVPIKKEEDEKKVEQDPQPDVNDVFDFERARKEVTLSIPKIHIASQPPPSRPDLKLGIEGKVITKSELPDFPYMVMRLEGDVLTDEISPMLISLIKRRLREISGEGRVDVIMVVPKNGTSYLYQTAYKMTKGMAEGFRSYMSGHGIKTELFGFGEGNGSQDS